MSRKSVLKNGFKVFDAGNIAGTITSNITNVVNLDKASIYISWTGTSPVGTITVEVTNDNPDITSPTFHEIDMGSAISVSGNSGNHNLIFTELPFNSIKLVYTSSSGTGSIDAVISAKSIG